jgi:hypothetical protein
MTKKTKPVTLSEISKAFDEWRANRQVSEQVPKTLWSLAITLLSHYSAIRITSALQITSKQFDRYIRQMDPVISKPPELPAKTVFVEVKPSVATPAKMLLEFKRADGMIASCDCQDISTFNQALNLFFGGQSCCS